MKATFDYKGYLGSAEFDLEHNILHGKLLFIKDVVTYEANSPAELKAEFESAVDAYLALCAELGDTPDTPCKGTFNVRTGQELHRSAVLYALKHDMSLNDVITKALEGWLRKEVATVEHHHDHSHHHEVVVTVSQELQVQEFNVQSASSTHAAPQSNYGNH